MQWKRDLHAEKGTVMVECFAYEKLEGTLQENLARHLEMCGVTLKPAAPKELWGRIAAEGESVLDGVIELFETVINLIKSNGYTIDIVRKKNTGNSNQRTNSILLTLLEPIYTAYEQHLKSNN
jgi:DNA helicase-4